MREYSGNVFHSNTVYSVSEPKVGDLAVCEVGRLGIIESKEEKIYIGTGLLDGEPWSSEDPRRMNSEDAIRLLASIAKSILPWKQMYKED